MESSTYEGLLGDAEGDRVVDLVDRRHVTTDLEVQAGTRVGATPARLDVRRVDHPLGVVLTLGGELALATVPVLQERLDHAVRGRAAVVIDLSRLRFIDSSGLDLLMRLKRQLSGAGVQLRAGARPAGCAPPLCAHEPGFSLRVLRLPKRGLTNRACATHRVSEHPPAGANPQTAAELDHDLRAVRWS